MMKQMQFSEFISEKIPKRASLYLRSLAIKPFLNKTVEGIFCGFWLTVLSQTELEIISQLYYQNAELYGDYDYTSQEYNHTGLHSWERNVINKLFPSSPAPIVVIGAGGGREVLALAKQGYQPIIGWECSSVLIKTASKVLSGYNNKAIINYTEPNRCPPSVHKFKAAVLGWGAYTLIRKSEQRIALLKELAKQLVSGSPILISFLTRKDNESHYAAAMLTNKLMRFLYRGEYVEIGDYLAMDYVHCFTCDEIAEEIQKAGLTLVYYKEWPYGHAVARYE